MLAVQPDIQLPEKSKNDQHPRQQQSNQFRTDAVSQPLLSQGMAN
jgi:hypothetical protein